MNYGLPYMGSKNRLIKKIQHLFPSAENFYDLFCGGCAVTDYFLREEKPRYKNFFINDIQGDIVQLYIDALQGKFKDRTEWVSREDFLRLKDQDAFIRVVWSFGNNGKDYMYGPNVEPYKKALHQAIVDKNIQPLLDGWGIDFSPLLQYNTCQERRVNYRKLVFKKLSDEGKLVKKGSHYYFSDKDSERRDTIQNLERLQQSQHLLQLQAVEQLQCLQNLERIENIVKLDNTNIQITPTSGDYQDIYIKPNSVIYCDIPYKDTSEYATIKFDYDRFYDWAGRQTELVLISEYKMPDDRFLCIGEFKKTVSMQATGSKKEKDSPPERIYIPRGQKQLWDTYTRTMNDGKINK